MIVCKCFGVHNSVLLWGGADKVCDAGLPYELSYCLFDDVCDVDDGVADFHVLFSCVCIRGI